MYHWMNEKSSQFVRLTPPGRGAVASLRVEGPKAAETIEAFFHARDRKPLRHYPADRIVVGRFGEEAGEEVVVRRCGDGAVEIHCHGGRAAATLIEKTLESVGFVSIAWQDWVASRDIDPITAAARVALADARTERIASALLDQFNGALRREMNEIQEAIARGDVAAAQRMQKAILDRVEFGRHLTCPWRVVLAGRPNVGKSSLLNALAGCNRAIVYATPGTTRDAVRFQTAIDGLPVELCDTAGLRNSTDAIEKAGIALAHERAAAADLVLLVSDLSMPWSDEDQALADAWPDAVVVHNKSDVPVAMGDRPVGIRVSAICGEEIDALLAEISHRLVPNPPPTGVAVPINEEQVEIIRHLIKC